MFLIDAFLSFIKYERRYSEHTYKAYKTDIEEFVSYLSLYESIDTVSKISHQHIRSWLVDLKAEKNNSPTSLRRKISTLKSYFKFLMKKGEVTHNPMVKINPPKVPKQVPSFINTNDIKRIFDEINFNDDFLGRQEKLIIETLYLTGIRRSELLNLKEKDIDSSNLTIKVFGKGGKERLLPVSNGFMASLQEHISEKNELYVNSEGHEYVFISKAGKKLNPKTVYYIVSHYLAQVSTLKKKSPHVLRHTFASHLLNEGADIKAIKDLLGHVSLASTQVYTHTNIEKLKSIYKNTHPRNKENND